MHLHLVDWLVICAYVVFALWVGIAYARRASKSVDEFFLSGRRLPWWIAGTSMVATTFAADTPLAITGWVRDHGIWQNWLWWCFGLTSMLGVFVFARMWRRGGVMTKAEFAELRYGGPAAQVLRGFLGVMHAGFTNTITLCWVLLAAAKIVDVLFQVDKGVALTLACVIALSYSLLAGFWGVVLTDLLQFVMSMVGAVVLAVIAWNAVGAIDGIQAAVGQGTFTAENLRLLPQPGASNLFEVAFWTTPVAVIAVYLGVGWWAAEGVDGGGLEVQRIAASRDERHGVLAVLWYSVCHYALRPWPWIMVALASLVVLPTITVTAPTAGTVVEVGDGETLRLQPADGSEVIDLALIPDGCEDDWRPKPRAFEPGAEITAGQVVSRTDSERAYVVMMTRYLPIGLLGLVAASLFAAFMSTIDTHVNLASSFFVNDLYRRFMKTDGDPRHYVTVARLASVGVMILAAVLAYQADSISDLFKFFLAFLSGVGPVYLLRWLWWRVRASTEIAAMAASAGTTIVLSLVDLSGVSIGPLSPADGGLLHEGRLLIVVGVSLLAAFVSLVVAGPPDPSSLVSFYTKVRPVGFWGPVRALAPSAVPRRSMAPVLLGIASGLSLVYGLLFSIGNWVLGQGVTGSIAFSIAIAGGFGVAWSLRRMRIEEGQVS